MYHRCRTKQFTLIAYQNATFTYVTMVYIAKKITDINNNNVSWQARVTATSSESSTFPLDESFFLDTLETNLESLSCYRNYE